MLHQGSLRIDLQPDQLSPLSAARAGRAPATTAAETYALVRRKVRRFIPACLTQLHRDGRVIGRFWLGAWCAIDLAAL
jgi:hypothetical protein